MKQKNKRGFNFDVLKKQCSFCTKRFNTIWIRAKYCNKGCAWNAVLKRIKTQRDQVGSKVYNSGRTERNRKFRLEAIKILGGKCAHCGFSDYRALQIDHINGDGFLNRKNGKDNWTMYRLIALKRGEINKFQVLCANCNWIKRVENNEVSNRVRKDFHNFIKTTQNELMDYQKITKTSI